MKRDEGVAETTIDKFVSGNMQEYPHQPLPLKKIIKNSLSITWENKFSLFFTLIIPYSLAAFLALMQIQSTSFYGPIAGFAIISLSSLISVLYTVSCHRFVLLGKSSVPFWGILVPAKREIRFWGWTITLFLIFGIFGMLIAIAIGLTGLLFGLLKVIPQSFIFILLVFPLGYLFSRWVLIFPAVAIDERPGLAWA